MLADLSFSDLFVCRNLELCGYKITSDALSVHPIPEALHAEVSAIFEHLQQQRKKGTDSRTVWAAQHQPDLAMRVKQITLGSGQPMYVLRRYATDFQALAKLGMPLAYIDKLMSPELKSGLVVYIGPPGSGKTTTACATVRERLKKFGGVAWTAENPIELPLEGVYGHGVCYQTEVSEDRQIIANLRDFYRTTPNMLMIGEIRTEAVATEVMSAAGSGYLVVATFHGNDLLGGISRLARLAGEHSAFALADVLRAAIHLKLVHASAKTLQNDLYSDLGSGIGIPPRVLVCQPLFIYDSDSQAVGIRSKIRDGNFHLLESELETQRRRSMNFDLP